ncbi:MAG: hypothetical protein HY760_03705, partial [Nitrospirae bacterium]|nr:hypothetical protein [Nitrospirota bacterium]
MAPSDVRTSSLSHAFTAFKEASESLERYYQSLEVQVRQLRLELQEKNEALDRNAREKEALKELAERKNRFTAMGEMVAKIVHDVRNPLGSIELFSSLLRRELTADEEKRTLAEQIMHGVRTINHALSNLLLFTQIPKPFRREVSLGGMIEESLQVLSHGIRRREIKAMAAVPPDLKVVCDETLMKQVFLNLFLNALQALSSGGRLEISGNGREIDGKEIAEVVVRDTGRGIS